VFVSYDVTFLETIAMRRNITSLWRFQQLSLQENQWVTLSFTQI